MIDIPILAKYALRDGTTRKNHRFIVLDDKGNEVITIDNDNLVSESVIYDERMCSGKEIKFGLCEGTNLEFQYFDTEEKRIGNITNKRIKAFIDVDYVDDDGTAKVQPIPMGFFTVDECSRQASTGIIKVSAYNKLLSDYLDEKANQNIIDAFGDGSTASMYAIRNALLEDYQIKEINANENTPIKPHQQILLTYWENHPEKYYLTQDYGIESPINGYYLKDGKTKPITITYHATPISFRIPANDLLYTFKWLEGNFIKLERDIRQWIADVLGNAKLTKTVGGEPLDAKYFLDHFPMSCGMGFGVGYYPSNVVSPTVPRNYSTVEKEFGKAGFDFSSKIIYEILKSNGAGTTKPTLWITLYWADAIYFDTNVESGETGSNPIYFNGAFNYFSNKEILYYADADHTEIATTAQKPIYFSNGEIWKIYGYSNCGVKLYEWESIDDADKIAMSVSDMPDVTLREITSSVYETQCEFGKLDRITDLFSGVKLNSTRLLPSDTLYPSDDLLPLDNAERINASIYSRLWADEGNIRNFRYLIVTYKGLDAEGKETEKKLQRTINTHGTDDYNMSSNWLFKNLVWKDADVAKYADAMVELMRNITWFPYEMWAAGLPYLETGDEVEIPSGDATYTSYILQRQLKGIQNLQDTFVNGTLNIF